MQLLNDEYDEFNGTAENEKRAEERQKQWEQENSGGPNPIEFLIGLIKDAMKEAEAERPKEFQSVGGNLDPEDDIVLERPKEF